MTQNSNNQDYSNETDGFILGGGTTKRDLTVTGADITLTGSGANTYTFPASTDTLVGRDSTDTLTNKTLTSGTNTFPTFNQNTTGSAATLTTPRTINGTSFNGSANITVPSDITPGTSGNVLTSNGTVWTSAAAAGGGDAQTANPLSQFAATTSAQLAGVISNETGSGLLVFGTAPNITNPTGIVKANVGLGNVDNTSDATKLTTTLLAVYPVGAIYISIVSTNPSSLFGGTWAAYGVGRMLISLDSGDTDFDTPEETGGAKTHTLTTAEMPSHNHIAATGANVGSGGVSNYLKTWDGTGTFQRNTENTGGGGAHNNMPPYIATYMFKRTA